MNNHVLVLWDVDLTLVDLGGVSQEIFTLAFEETAGRPLRSMPEMPGRTDKAILLDALAMHDIPATELGSYYAALADAAETLQERIRALGRQMPGAENAIAALADHGVMQSVVTGNLRPVAQLKLATLGLTVGIDCNVGAYGSEDTDRAALVRSAHRRAERSHNLTLDQVVVVGDTPFDMAAAHRADAGVLAIGVATGHHTSDDLKAAGADVVLSDLTEIDSLTAAVVGPRSLDS